MEKLHLPSLRGSIGSWNFFSTVMRIKDIVQDNRIITVGESKELYSNNINEILQRDLKQGRVSAIKKYLVTNEERFFSSLIVAIHKGNPEWADFDIEEHFKIEETKLNKEQVKFIENKLGILTLSGTEEIFALDGQHRLTGLRAALKSNPEIGSEELSLIFVVHNHQIKERTRRLFTVLNKYAEKPKGAELIILDEDDSASILTRKLVTEHHILSKDNAISNSTNGNIPNSDLKSFTTLVTINQINKILFSKPANFYTERQNQSVLDELYNISVDFWDFLFESFPEINSFLSDENVSINGSVFNRNNISGGSLLLRPVGQVLISKVYKDFKTKGAAKLNFLKDNIRKVDFNLSGEIWNYLYWNDGKMIPKNDTLKKNILNFLLGNLENEKSFKKEIEAFYSSVNVTYNGHLKPL